MHLKVKATIVKKGEVFGAVMVNLGDGHETHVSSSMRFDGVECGDGNCGPSSVEENASCLDPPGIDIRCGHHVGEWAFSDPSVDDKGLE